MDYRVDWSPEAVEDLESLRDYIRRDSEVYARLVITKIINLVRELISFPRMGRVVPELGDETIREGFVYSYRVIYRLGKERILIVAIIHGKRLLETVSERL